MVETTDGVVLVLVVLVLLVFIGRRLYGLLCFGAAFGKTGA